MNNNYISKDLSRERLTWKESEILASNINSVEISRNTRLSGLSAIFFAIVGFLGLGSVGVLIVVEIFKSLFL